MPTWLHDQIQGLTEMDGVPFALAGPTPIAGLLISYPLKAGAKTPTKIIWVVSTPLNDSGLDIRVHPSGTAQPLISVSRPVDAGPVIFNDGVSVPTSGCWHFSLQWAKGRAELDLLYNS
jgi:hypothetical protein